MKARWHKTHFKVCNQNLLSKKNTSFIWIAYDNNIFPIKVTWSNINRNNFVYIEPYNHHWTLPDTLLRNTLSFLEEKKCSVSFV